MRVEWINHKGKKVLFIDYNGIKSQDEMFNVLMESMKTVKESHGKVLVLSDVTDSSLGPDFMKKAKEEGKTVAGKAQKTAIIGVSGLKSMLLKGYNLFTGETTQPYATKEEALDYLVS